MFAFICHQRESAVADSDTHESVHGPRVFYDFGWSDGCIFELVSLVHIVHLIHQQEQPGLRCFIDS